MSTFAVTLETIATITPVIGADKIDVATLEAFPEWHFVVRRNQFRIGDPVIYFPIDSVLPEPVITALGLTGKLAGAAKNRVKTVTLRGQISQGVCARPQDLASCPPPHVDWAFGADLKDVLGVTKYEPPAIPCRAGNLVKLPTPVYDIEGTERFPEIVEALMDEPVCITEKIEGSHLSVTLHADGRFDVCQRNYKIDPIDGHEHDWHRVVRELGLEDKMRDALRRERWLEGSITLRGEIVGPKIQNNIYAYASLTAYAFDLEIDSVFVDPEWFLEFTRCKSIAAAPVLAQGITLRKWLDGRSLAEAADGESGLAPVAREGIVIRPMRDMHMPKLGRVILKKRGPKYLAGSDL